MTAMGTSAPSSLQRHPIRVVTVRTGLSPDVLRVWERRYGAVHPARSAGGQRLYSDADIERLTRLHQATRAGRTISQVVDLPDAEIDGLVAGDEAARAQRAAAVAPRDGDAAADASLSSALDAIRELDAEALEQLLRRAAVRFGAEPFIAQVLAPLLARIGEQWESGALGIAHEHAASGVVRRLLNWIISAFSVPADAPVLVIATPAGERHEFGAMLAAATAAGLGWRGRYLGSDLPADAIATAARQTDARCVALSLVHGGPRAEVVAELVALRSALGADVPIVAGGGGATSLSTKQRDGVHVVADLRDFAELLRRLAPPSER